MGTTVGPQNPPDGWTCVPATAWGTNFVMDTSQFLCGSTSIKVPAYAANAGNSSIQLIGPPTLLNGLAASSIPCRYNPRVYLFNNAATGRLTVQVQQYQTQNLGSSAGGTLTTLNSGAIGPYGWIQRSALVASQLGYCWARMIFTLDVNGSTDIWIGGVEFPRIAPGLIAKSGATVNITGGAGFTSIQWNGGSLVPSNQVQVDDYGAFLPNSALYVDNAGFWSVDVDVVAPAALASGTSVSCQIVDATGGSNNTLTSYTQVVTQPGGGGVAQNLQFRFLVYLLGSGYDIATGAFSGYPYVIQISHNDGVNIRNFATAYVRMVYHR